MIRDEDVEQALAQYERTREHLLHADENDFAHHLETFVRELRGNALVSALVRSLPPCDGHAWWIATLDQAEKSYAPARLDFPDDDDERLALLTQLLSALAADDPRTGCTVRELAAVQHCYKFDEAVALARELVIRPFCQLLEARLDQEAAARSSSGLDASMRRADG